MKNIIAIIIILVAAINVNAQIIGSFTTTVEAGVIGEVNTLTPNVAIYGNEENTMLFDEVIITKEGTTTYTISNNEDDINFNAFVRNLVSMTEDDLIKVGHKVNGIKTSLSSDVKGWFGKKIDFNNYNITMVKISYSEINFEKNEKNSSKNKSWTDFSYNVNISIYGTSNTITAQK